MRWYYPGIYALLCGLKGEDLCVFVSHQSWDLAIFGICYECNDYETAALDWVTLVYYVSASIMSCGLVLL